MNIKSTIGFLLALIFMSSCGDEGFRQEDATLTPNGELANLDSARDTDFTKSV